MDSRDLLIVFLLWLTGGLAWRGRGPPPLGPPHPQPRCARPVEIIGEGVSCDGAEERGGAARRRVARMSPARLQAFGAPIDLNRASAAELASLDGIGPKLALRIMAARPFSGVDDLLRVRGIGERRLARLRPRLLVTPGTRTNVLLDE